MDNMTALAYLMKMELTKHQKLVSLSKNIWHYLLKRKITITSKYLPGSMNRDADMASGETKDSSKWKLNLGIFKQLCQSRGTPETDLWCQGYHTNYISTYHGK